MRAVLSRLLRAGRIETALAPVKLPSNVEGFTAHNIVLDDGTQTYPQAGWTMDRSTILHAALRTLRLAFPDGLAGKSIIDVGCLEGGFATEFARQGMQALGIEIRDSNFRNCRRVKAGTDLPNLAFVQADAMNIGACQPVDAVFACGLLYHLDRPRTFLDAASRICKRVILLETHVAPAEDEHAVRFYGLSDMAEHEGMRGRWYSEYGNVTPSELDALKWASWSNGRSFWPQKEHLLQTLLSLGFTSVFEQFDCEADLATQYTSGWRRQHARVFLVGIR